MGLLGCLCAHIRVCAALQRLHRHPTARQSRTVPENTIQMSTLPQTTSSLQRYIKRVFHLRISWLACLIQSAVYSRLDQILSSRHSEDAGRAGGGLNVWHVGVHSGLRHPTRLRCAVCSVTSGVSNWMWPLDCSPPGSSVHGILQARILEWVAMLSSRGSSRPRNQTHISGISCIAGGFFTHWITWEACPTRLRVVKGRRAICSYAAAPTSNVSWTLPAKTKREKKNASFLSWA